MEIGALDPYNVGRCSTHGVRYHPGVIALGAAHARPQCVTRLGKQSACKQHLRRTDHIASFWCLQKHISAKWPWYSFMTGKICRNAF